MKIKRLKRRADALAADAHACRLAYRTHASRSIAIVRRRVGSTAGLAILFSLGFMTGARQGGKVKYGRNREGGGERSFASRLAHGPLGESAIKLGMALMARSLLKREEESPDTGASPATHDWHA